MNWSQFFSQLVIAVLSAGVAATVALIGWYQTNQYAVDRERQNREKDMRVLYLIDAYDKLANASNRNPPVEKFNEMMEIAVAKIQLFGSVEEIRLLYVALDEWRETELRKGQPQANFDPLLKALRNRLRDDLRMDKLPTELGAVRWVRPNGMMPPPR